MMNFEILKVKMNNEVFSVGDTVIRKGGISIAKIVRLALTETETIVFYPDEKTDSGKHLSNFRNITISDLENINKLQYDIFR